MSSSSLLSDSEVDSTKIDTDEFTYLTTDQLAERIHYDARTIRTRLKDSVLKENIHYIRPFGGRKLLFIWEHIKRDMAALQTTPIIGPEINPKPSEKRKPGKRWSPLEDSRLREAWGQVPTAQLAKEMSRPIHGIHQRVRKLGLARLDAWTEVELDLMREHYEEDGAKGMALRLDRTEKAIQLQARRMGLFVRPRHRGWTPKEDALLHMVVGRLPLRQIHEVFFEHQNESKAGSEFCRTYAAVAQRCGALGISLSREEAATLGTTFLDASPPNVDMTGWIGRASTVAASLLEGPLKNFVAQRSESGVGPGHLRWMAEQLAARELDSDTDACRWLGYIQGALVERGATTLEEEEERNQSSCEKP